MLRHPMTMIRDFLRYEAAGGILLMIAAFLAIVVANSPLDGAYEALKALPVSVRLGNVGLSETLLHWVNDGLMALFFFLVGLEIKREFLGGELSTPAKAALPVLAALGGMAVPGLIYWAVNADSPETLRGWAIPTATDIAFALGVITLVGSRVPIALKVLLTALAVIDDLGAILIIALFYTADLSLLSLAIAALGTLALLALNLRGVVRTAPYVVVGLITWVAVLESGVHATMAGVITALAIPFRAKSAGGRSPLEHLEHALHPWIAFGVLPLFGFMNAGVNLGILGWEFVFAPVTFGILLGLFAGKQLGVFGAIWLAVRTGLVPKPAGSGWLQVYGMAVLAGIGFTMSLFIGDLAFYDETYAAEVRLGVLFASLLSAVAGFAILRFCRSPSMATRKARR